MNENEIKDLLRIYQEYLDNKKESTESENTDSNNNFDWMKVLILILIFGGWIIPTKKSDIDLTRINENYLSFLQGQNAVYKEILEGILNEQR